jgi:hypothetical protein
MNSANDEAKEEIANGEYLTHKEFKKETKKWLDE